MDYARQPTGGLPMKRMFFAIAILLFVGACLLPTNLLPNTAGEPTVVSESIQTSLPTDTATLPPTFTAVSVTDTSIPPTTSPVPTETATETTTPFPNLTTTPATATEFTVSPAVLTSTLAITGSGTPSPTPGVLTYGTLPPEVPFSQINLVNRAKRQAYISLQVTTIEGGATILEYPVYGRIKVKAPLGYYLYVAWVGGNKMVGEFRLHRGAEITIILYPDRVEIK